MIGTALWMTALLFTALLLYGFLENFHLKTEYYTIHSKKAETTVRFVLLSDLHGCLHGKNNERLLVRIQKAAPDFICISGDLTLKSGKHTDRVLSFVKEITKMAPVYYAPGNHEIRMPEYETYKAALRRCGVHYLENRSEKILEKLWITGLNLPEYWYHKCWQKRSFSKDEMKKLLGECRKEPYTILLAHNPEYFDQYAEWGADLTLGGHLHGGIAILPFLGGVISPSLRLFPKYDFGEFTQKGKKMIISRGLGLHHIKFRFFNRPELAVIQVVKDEKCP